MLRTNVDRLPMIAVEGSIRHPMVPATDVVGVNGTAYNAVSMGGITYNFQVGDNCMQPYGEHVEPGVTTRNLTNPGECMTYSTYSCVGNTAMIASGPARGAKGFVTGEHGGCEHVICWFDQETLMQLTYEDKVLVRSWGNGLQLLDYPDIMCMNLDPNLLNKMGIREENGKLIVPVTHKIPNYLMGSGKGASRRQSSMLAQSGDYDIITSDKEEVEARNFNDLRYGDIVLLEDADNTYGRGYLQGAVTIGVVIHGDTLIGGHGPGVTTLLTCKKPLIEGVIDKNANIAYYLGIKDIEE